MAIGDINLSAAAQANLTALQNTAKLLQMTQAHLATGKTVNSASDNATAYFASKGFLNAANGLATVKSNLSTALEAVNSFDNSISDVTQVINQLQGLCTQALATSDTVTQAGLATQYNSLCVQLDQMVNDSAFNGNNLLNSTTNNMVVYFNAGDTTSLTIQGVNISSKNLIAGNEANPSDTGAPTSTSAATEQYSATGADLGSVGAEGGWSTTGTPAITTGILTPDVDNNAAGGVVVPIAQQIKNDQARLLTALNTLTTAAAGFGGNATLIQTRQDFTSNMMSSLTNASNDLVSADTNLEGANMQALQAQDSLGIVSLGVSGMLASAILKIL
jgi:flagellin